jgi:hypothetical protein
VTITRTLRSLHGNKVAAAIEELHRVENDLAGALLTLSDRHKVDHEVFYVARDLAVWSQDHVRDLARVGQDYGLDLDPEPESESSILAKMKQKGAELAAGRHHNAGVLLLADLRHIHGMAAGTSLDWEILAQSAQALKDTELLGIAQKCHPDTLRQMRWANAKLKEASAQIMVTG